MRFKLNDHKEPEEEISIYLKKIDEGDVAVGISNSKGQNAALLVIHKDGTVSRGEICWDHFPDFLIEDDNGVHITKDTVFIP